MNRRTTFWVDERLRKEVLAAAVKNGVKGGFSGAVRLGLKMWLDSLAAAKSLKVATEQRPQIRIWFEAYNEQRLAWGAMLGKPMRPVALTQPAAKLIKARLEKYGLERLLAILYKVPWSPYLMGEGYYAGNGPRLAISNILKINAKINSIEALEAAENPEALRRRGKMFEIEAEYKRAKTSNIADDIKRQTLHRLEMEFEQLQDELEALT